MGPLWGMWQQRWCSVCVLGKLAGPAAERGRDISTGAIAPVLDVVFLDLCLNFSSPPGSSPPWSCTTLHALGPVWGSCCVPAPGTPRGFVSCALLAWLAGQRGRGGALFLLSVLPIQGQVNRAHALSSAQGAAVPLQREVTVPGSGAGAGIAEMPAGFLWQERVQRRGMARHSPGPSHTRLSFPPAFAARTRCRGCLGLAGAGPGMTLPAVLVPGALLPSTDRRYRNEPASVFSGCAPVELR